VVFYLSTVGLDIGDVAASTAGIALGERLYARFNTSEVISISIAGLGIILIASLYPAWLASKQEPIEALRAL
jgi:ABC-type lipoprotein release transport system permease subunit